MGHGKPRPPASIVLAALALFACLGILGLFRADLDAGIETLLIVLALASGIFLTAHLFNRYGQAAGSGDGPHRTAQAFEVDPAGLKAIIDNAPMEIYLKDSEGRYVYVNRQFEDLFNVRNRDIAGKLPADIYDPEFAAVTRDHDLEVLRTGQTIPREVEANTQLGRQILHTIKFPVHDDDGKIAGLGAVVNDVTQLKAAERAARSNIQTLTAILENAPPAVHVKDAEGIYLTVNATYERIYDVRRENVIGRTIEDIDYPHSEAELTRILEADRQVLKDGAVQRYQIANPRPGGEQTHLDVVKFPVVDDEDRIFGIGAIETDITDQRAVMEDLIASRRMAEEASLAKSEFLATMSHEFRTPLNAILGFSEIIRGEHFGPIGTEAYATYANDIHQSGTHLLNLVNDILDIAAIEAGKRRYEFADIELGPLISEQIHSFDMQITRKKLSIAAEIADAMPLLRADRRSVMQIVLNLLSNAIKFTPEGGRVTITGSWIEGNGHVIRVEDSGPGIPSADIKIVTEPFSQVRANPHLAGAGTGLGLSIIKSLVEAHNGRLEIESPAGKGTRVTVILPSSQ